MGKNESKGDLTNADFYLELSPNEQEDAEYRLLSYLAIVQGLWTFYRPFYSPYCKAPETSDSDRLNADCYNPVNCCASSNVGYSLIVLKLCDPNFSFKYDM